MLGKHGLWIRERFRQQRPKAYITNPFGDMKNKSCPTVASHKLPNLKIWGIAAMLGNLGYVTNIKRALSLHFITQHEKKKKINETARSAYKEQ